MKRMPGLCAGLLILLAPHLHAELVNKLAAPSAPYGDKGIEILAEESAKKTDAALASREAKMEAETRDFVEKLKKSLDKSRAKFEETREYKEFKKSLDQDLQKINAPYGDKGIEIQAEKPRQERAFKEAAARAMRETNAELAPQMEELLKIPASLIPAPAGSPVKSGPAASPAKPK